MHSSHPARLVLFDPGFSHAVGHHADLNGALLPLLQAHGWCVEIWADCAAADDPRLRDYAPALRPLLRNAGYIDPRHWCDLAGSLHQAALLRSPLEQAVAGAAVHVWLAHSLLPFQLIALARLLQHQPPARVLISLMFAPGEVFAGQPGHSLDVQRQAAELNARTAIAALARASAQAGHQLLLCAGSQLLIERYTPLCAAAALPPPQLHPCLLGGAGQLAFEPGFATEEPPLQLLLHWGERKPDKGRDLALAVLQQVLDGAVLPEPLQQAQWCFHACGSAPAEPAERDLLERAAAHPRMRVLSAPLPRARMLEEFARSAVALLPYCPLAYAERSSGVLWLYAAARLALQRPPRLVTHPSGWLWQEVQAFGLSVCPLADPADPQKALAALAEVLQRPAHLAALTPYGHRVLTDRWDHWLVNQLHTDRLG